MRRQTISCNHYRSMMDHKTCSAGVDYETLKAIPYGQRPCFARNGEPPPGGCHLAQFPTAEEIEAEDKEIAERFAKTVKAREAIVSHLGGPWKRGTPGASGRIDCPVCNAKESLRFSRAGYNGHIHAACTTDGCVSWME